MKMEFLGSLLFPQGFFIICLMIYFLHRCLSSLDIPQNFPWSYPARQDEINEINSRATVCIHKNNAHVSPSLWQLMNIIHMIIQWFKGVELHCCQSCLHF